MSSFSASESLYQACFNSYSRYGSDLGHMHMPIFINERDTFENCLQNLNSEVCKLIPKKPGLRLLDIGCGRGGLATSVAKIFDAKVVGISSCQDEVDSAKKLARNLGIENLCHFEVKDMNNITAKDFGKFDVVLSIESECYFSSIKQAIHTTKSLLAENGCWITARISYTTDDLEKCCKFLGKNITTGWEMAPIASSKVFSDAAIRNYSTDTSHSYSKGIVKYWEELAPISLDASFLIKGRFLWKSVIESQNILNWRTVYRHRLAFYYLVKGLERKCFDYRVHKLTI